jgi:hypothetical protein
MNSNYTASTIEAREETLTQQFMTGDFLQSIKKLNNPQPLPLSFVSLDTVSLVVGSTASTDEWEISSILENKLLFL